MPQNALLLLPYTVKIAGSSLHLLFHLPSIPVCLLQYHHKSEVTAEKNQHSVIKNILRFVHPLPLQKYRSNTKDILLVLPFVLHEKESLFVILHTGSLLQVTSSLPSMVPVETFLPRNMGHPQALCQSIQKTGLQAFPVIHRLSPHSKRLPSPYF